MRTTITLDDDVAANLENEMRRTGRSFKAVLNDVVRRGLTRRSEPEQSPPFEVRAKCLGLRPGLSYDNIEELLDIVESPIRQ